MLCCPQNTIYFIILSFPLQIILTVLLIIRYNLNTHHGKIKLKLCIVALQKDFVQ